jgi:molecular chaperone GrpE
MENLRARTKREVEGAKLFGIHAFCKDIVSVADVLELALASVKDEASSNVSANATDAKHAPVLEKSDSHRIRELVEGLSLTLREMHKVFAKHGLAVLDPLHQRFDPNLHTALFEIASKDVEPGIVVAVQQKGYFLNQRLLRSASVGVSKAT